MIGCTLPCDDDNQDDENESTDIPVFVEKVAISRKYIPLSVWQCTVSAMASSVYDACQVYIPSPAMLRHAHSTRAQAPKSLWKPNDWLTAFIVSVIVFGLIQFVCSAAMLIRSLALNSLSGFAFDCITHSSLLCCTLLCNWRGRNTWRLFPVCCVVCVVGEQIIQRTSWYISTLASTSTPSLASVVSAWVP